ncbi:flagellar hook-length control protein FliK [Neobacillus sp. FSL H8-0543]|uniref:flagellar hook-length control protein FliK n=1 Tax=Neobacillus sp. FSL H8-0543 TaxID=2954672 RepID=UPI00315826D0
MLQFPGVDNKVINRSSNITELDVEKTNLFDTMFQLIGQQQQQEKDTELLQGSNQWGLLASLQQNGITGPLILPVPDGGEKMNTFTQEVRLPQAEPNRANQTLVNNLLDSNGGIPAPASQTEEMTADVEALLQVKDSSVLQEKLGEQEIRVSPYQTNDGDSNQNEQPNGSQTGNNTNAEAVTIVNSTAVPTFTSDVEAMQNPPQPVRAAQFNQDVTLFIQSTINGLGVKDGIEAAFTLTPEHLGKVEVKVTIQDGQVTAEFLTNTPIAKDLLETHVQTLRSALETQGLQVTKIDIAQQSTLNSNFMGTFSQKGESNQRQAQQESRKRSNQQLIQIEYGYQEYENETGWVSQINTTA